MNDLTEIYGKPVIATKDNFIITRDRDVEEAKLSNYIIYSIYEYIPDLGPPQHFGDLGFWSEIGSGRAAVFTSRLDREYRKRGLGTFLYKTAINDLVKMNYVVNSGFKRTSAAEHLWQRLIRENPGLITMKQTEKGKTYYQVSQHVSRRPARVRGYRRKW